MTAMELPLQPPRLTAAWARYKALYDQSAQAKNLVTVQKLSQQAEQLSSSLFGMLQGRQQLHADLMFLLQGLLQEKQTVWEPKHRGRPPRPDWMRVLKPRVRHMMTLLRVLDTNRKLHWDDPWISSTLGAALPLRLTLLEDARNQLKQETAQPDAVSDASKTILHDADVQIQAAKDYKAANAAHRVE